MPLGGDVTKVITPKSSDATLKVAEDKKSSPSADTSEKITDAMIQIELNKFGTKKSTSAGNRYIIMLRAGKDPLTFRSNAEFKRYLKITGNVTGHVRKVRVKPEYGGQQVAGKYIIHVPKEIYDGKNLARFK